MAGQWLSARLLVRDLAQVARYLGRREADEHGHTLDQRIRARLHTAMGDGPVIVFPCPTAGAGAERARLSRVVDPPNRRRR